MDAIISRREALVGLAALAANEPAALPHTEHLHCWPLNAPQHAGIHVVAPVWLPERGTETLTLGCTGGA